MDRLQLMSVHASTALVMTMPVSVMVTVSVPMIVTVSDEFHHDSEEDEAEDNRQGFG